MVQRVLRQAAEGIHTMRQRSLDLPLKTRSIGSRVVVDCCIRALVFTGLSQPEWPPSSHTCANPKLC